MSAVLTIGQAAATMPERLARVDALADLPTQWEPELDARRDALHTPERVRDFAEVLDNIAAADLDESIADEAELGRLLVQIMARKRSLAASLLILTALEKAADPDVAVTIEDAKGALNFDIQKQARECEQGRFEAELAERMTSIYF